MRKRAEVVYAETQYKNTTLSLLLANLKTQTYKVKDLKSHKHYFYKCFNSMFL